LQTRKYVIDYMPQSRLRTPADIGALIRDRRHTLRLDQAELAHMIGVSRLWVNQVERGKPGASLGLVLRAVDMLGISLVADVADLAVTQPAGAAPVITAPVITADIDAIVADARRTDRS
jgi:HTH-type transcriptional regulator / antitoxin HipB